jgi:hypothetical protein
MRSFSLKAAELSALDRGRVVVADRQLRAFHVARAVVESHGHVRAAKRTAREIAADRDLRAQGVSIDSIQSAG